MALQASILKLICTLQWTRFTRLIPRLRKKTDAQDFVISYLILSHFKPKSASLHWGSFAWQQPQGWLSFSNRVLLTFPCVGFIVFGFIEFNAILCHSSNSFNSCFWCLHSLESEIWSNSGGKSDSGIPRFGISRKVEVEYHPTGPTGRWGSPVGALGASSTLPLANVGPFPQAPYGTLSCLTISHLTESHTYKMCKSIEIRDHAISVGTIYIILYLSISSHLRAFHLISSIVISLPLSYHINTDLDESTSSSYTGYSCHGRLMKQLVSPVSNRLYTHGEAARSHCLGQVPDTQGLWPPSSLSSQRTSLLEVCEKKDFDFGKKQVILPRKRTCWTQNS